MKLWNYIKDRMLTHPEQEICEETAKMTYEEVVIYTEYFSKMLTGKFTPLLLRSLCLRRAFPNQMLISFWRACAPRRPTLSKTASDCAFL